MGAKILTIAQENAIFKAKPQLVGGEMSGPSWSSLAKKYNVSVGTVQTVDGQMLTEEKRAEIRVAL